MVAVGDLKFDPDGKHLWVAVRCTATEPASFGSECLDSKLDPSLQFDRQGNLVKSFGGDLFIWPHGLDVDREGNVWATDAVSAKRTPPGKRGQQLIKFSPEGNTNGHAFDAGNNRAVISRICEAHGLGVGVNYAKAGFSEKFRKKKAARFWAALEGTACVGETRASSISGILRR